MITALQAPNQNFGKDEYAIDMMGHEAHYWQGTESGLLGAFEFKGACTAGDGSYDTDSKSMGAGFCNLGQLGWNTQTPLPPPVLHEQRTRNSRKVGREDEGVSSTRPETSEKNSNYLPGQYRVNLKCEERTYLPEILFPVNNTSYPVNKK
jgi:hypothetical protein